MPMLTESRELLSRDGAFFSFLAGAQIFKGSLVALVGGKAVPASADLALTVVGIATKNAEAGEACSVRREGCFLFNNAGGADALSLTHVGRPAFVLDDHTVAATDGGATRPLAGIVRDVDLDADCVWLEF